MFIPHNRVDGNLQYYLSFVDGDTQLIFSYIPEKCREEAKVVFCHYYFPKCGNSTVFEPPTSACEDTCNHLRSLCPIEWELAREYFEERPDLAEKGFTLVNCSNTGEYLPPSHCCEVPGIEKCKCNSVHPLITTKCIRKQHLGLKSVVV